MDDAGVQLAAASLTASKSAPHLSWRSSGTAKLAAIEKNWELHIPLRPNLRKQLKQQQAGTWRDATQVRYDETGPRSNPGPVRRRSTAAPNPAAGFASAVLSCELSMAEALSREQVHRGGLEGNRVDGSLCMRSCAPYSRGCAPMCEQVRRGGTPGSSSGGPSNGSAEECLAALARLAEIVPAAFCPVLQRVAGALEPLVFSSEWAPAQSHTCRQHHHRRRHRRHHLPWAVSPAVAADAHPPRVLTRFTDSDGRRMPYAQFVNTVSRKWVLDAKAAESLAKQDLARAMLEVESLEVKGVASLEGVARALLDGLTVEALWGGGGGGSEAACVRVALGIDAR